MTNQISVTCVHCSSVSPMNINPNPSSEWFNCPNCRKKTIVYFRNNMIYKTTKY